MLLGSILFARFRGAIPPLIIALILAYILIPIVRILQSQMHIPRTVASFLAYLILLGVFTAGIGLIIPPLALQLSGLNVDVQLFLGEVQSIFERQVTVVGVVVDLEAVFTQMIEILQGGIEPVFGPALGFAVEVITSLVWLVFILVISFYLVKDAPVLWKWLDNLVPPQYQHDYQLLRDEIAQIWAAFFRGQLVLALVVATIFTITGFLIGLPFALAMGVVAGLLEFLPSVGHVIWLVTAALLALFAGSTWLPIPNWVFMLVVVGLQLTFQQFDINYLIPRIIGRRVHLPPLVVILGIVSGAALAGVLGIFLAAPTIASTRVIGRYIYANLFDMDPFDKPAAAPLPPPNLRWWERIGRAKKDTSSQELA